MSQIIVEASTNRTVCRCLKETIGTGSTNMAHLFGAMIHQNHPSRSPESTFHHDHQQERWIYYTKYHATLHQPTKCGEVVTNLEVNLTISLYPTLHHH